MVPEALRYHRFIIFMIILYLHLLLHIWCGRFLDVERAVNLVLFLLLLLLRWLPLVFILFIKLGLVVVVKLGVRLRGIFGEDHSLRFVGVQTLHHLVFSMGHS
jgi:hypothetical protein